VTEHKPVLPPAIVLSKKEEKSKKYQPKAPKLSERKETMNHHPRFSKKFTDEQLIKSSFNN
jgi:hypothetical protein